MHDKEREKLKSYTKEKFSCPCGETTYLLEQNPNHFVGCISHNATPGHSPEGKQKRWLSEQSRYSFFGPCHFSAGLVIDTKKAGVPNCDKIYLEMGKKTAGLHRVFLMPEEAQAIVSCLSHSLFKLDAKGTWKKVLKKRMKQ